MIRSSAKVVPVTFDPPPPNGDARKAVAESVEAPMKFGSSLVGLVLGRLRAKDTLVESVDYAADVRDQQQKERARLQSAVVSREEHDAPCMPPRHPVLAARAAWGQGPPSSAPAAMQRQVVGPPRLVSAGGGVPSRRCISAGANSRASAAGPSPSRPVAKPAAATGAAYPSEGGIPSSGPAGPSTGSLLTALQNFTAAASDAASELASTRQQHEALLQQQREQFQRLMLAHASKTTLRTGSGPETPTHSSRSGGTVVASGPSVPPPSPASVTATAPAADNIVTHSAGHCNSCLRTPISKPPHYPGQHCLQRAPPPTPQTEPPKEPHSITEVHRGVQITMPIGCRVEAGERPSSLLVLGPRVEVELDVREGPSVVLVASNCVCTIRRVDGRPVVHIPPPLLGRSRQQSQA